MITPEVGAVIGGMRIDAVAGRGGMGVVYRAHQLTLDRTVALKIVNPEFADDREFHERFRREARLAAALDHPHVVPVFHAGDADGHLYLAMRYIEGTDLGSMIEERGRIEPPDAAEIVAQIASALDAAHARGLVHRDVKPANILVTRPEGRWHAYLTDFGITKDIGDSGLTQEGVAIGTLAYMSPEQFAGGAIDGRSDVYALGCVLFHALTGTPPFLRDSAAAQMYAHLHALPPRLGAALDPVLARALAKQADDRYASAGAFGRDALAAAAGARIAPHVPSPQARPPAAPPTLVDPPRRPTRRSLLVAGGIAVAAMAGAALAQLVPTAASTTGGTDEATSPAPDNPAGRVAGAPIPVGLGPRDIADGEGYIWTANTGGGSISRIDPATGVSTEIVVGGQPNQVVVGHGTAWAWNYLSSLAPVDVATGQVGELVDMLFDITGIAAGGDSVWFVAPDDAVVGRVDMRSGTFTGDVVTVGGRPGSIAAGAGKVYVVDRTNRTLVTIDEARGAVVGEPLPLPAGLINVFAVGADVYATGPGGFARLGSGTSTPDQVVPLDGATAIAVGPDSAWVCDEDRNEVRRLSLDLSTPVAAPLQGIGAGCGDMEFVDGVLWFANRVENTVTRIEPAPL